MAQEAMWGLHVLLLLVMHKHKEKSTMLQIVGLHGQWDLDLAVHCFGGKNQICTRATGTSKICSGGHPSICGMTVPYNHDVGIWYHTYSHSHCCTMLYSYHYYHSYYNHCYHTSQEQQLSTGAWWCCWLPIILVATTALCYCCLVLISIVHSPLSQYHSYHCYNHHNHSSSFLCCCSLLLLPQPKKPLP